MTPIIPHHPRSIIRRVLWLLRRVLYGPTYYDRLRATGHPGWERQCMRRGGGTLVYTDRGPVPHWLEFLP